MVGRLGHEWPSVPLVDAASGGVDFSAGLETGDPGRRYFSAGLETGVPGRGMLQLL